ncbi:MAG: DUF1704 domain-containing protein [Myxococcales bacterium]|nr:DUF1704 domain-containing protein [Myxococcales bacterium]
MQELPAPWLEADADIVKAARRVRLLSYLSWPTEIQTEFLTGFAKGNARLPKIEYQIPPLTEETEIFRSVPEHVDGDHPIADFLRQTARSYRLACALLDAAGTPKLRELSEELYGAPEQGLSGTTMGSGEAAAHFLRVSDEYAKAVELHDADYCLPAESMQREMQPRLDAVLGVGVVRVEIDEALASKAAAGATRVRLRGGTSFSEYDLEQLIQHEAFIHSLTALNGRRQPHLKSLGLGAPRTTATQEGLATFAELVTGSIDIARLRRVALRVLAIDMALEGANFIEVFRYFLEAGQSEMESFNSAMRVFRGAPVEGGVAFTKDAVYLRGLIEVHTFFRWCMHRSRLESARALFAGRMTLEDVELMNPSFEDGTVAGPALLPPWMTKTNGLAGYLAFSVFASQIHVSKLPSDYYSPAT